MSKEDLKPMPPWKPGESGNPKGYPKGVPNRSTIAREVLGIRFEPHEKILKVLIESYPALEKKLTLEKIGHLVLGLKMVIDKDVQAYKALMDSAYGSPVQDINSNQQITHDITYSNIPTNELVDRLNKLMDSEKKG